MTICLAELDHPLRETVNNEVHARPSEPLGNSCAISYVVLVHGPDTPDPHEQLSALLELLDLPSAQNDQKFYAASAGDFQLRWELHTEFSRYSFKIENPTNEPFESPPIEKAPEQWIATLRGQVMVAINTRIEPLEEPDTSLSAISKAWFDGNILVGSQIGSGSAIAVTDFRIREDGFNRLLVLNHAMNEMQTGRMVQRLLEIDTYRVLTLLALPVAQGLQPQLREMESEIASISNLLAQGDQESDQGLLDRIILLDAESESKRLNSQYRFSAADAYYELVVNRIEELREIRINGVQNFDEFTTRRLSPAVKTCRSTAARQSTLSERMARATQLLSTRVDVERQKNQQELLASMNNRAKTQLRLQATVEGLSVAAITYYVVGLMSYIASGLKDLGVAINPKLATAISVPFVAVAIFIAVRKVRQKVSGDAVDE